jgi:hypothetical protein
MEFGPWHRLNFLKKIWAVILINYSRLGTNLGLQLEHNRR